MSEKWTPIIEDDLLKEVEEGVTKMQARELLLWELIRVTPKKWALNPWGDSGGGFWVVAIAGEKCVYYNDIEDGFNVSRYSKHGVISEYFCNQDELQWVIRRMLE